MLSLLVQVQRKHGGQSFTSMLVHLGAAGLFFLAILDSSPIPTFGGPDIVTAILAASRRALWYEYAACATAGSVIGAYLTFHLARKAGSAYLEKKFRKSVMRRFQQFFKKWGTGTLIASTMIPLPTPTSMFFAAAGASDYPQARFLGIVAVSRTVRYFGIAYVASVYGRSLLRVLRHPTQHLGWLLLFVALTGLLVAGGILLSRRLEQVPVEAKAS